MRHPFSPDPREIGLLQPHDFTELVNGLLFAEAGRAGIPPADVSVTVRGDVADGGIDARVLAPDVAVSRWINIGLNIYQFKKGKVVEGALRKEWQKLAVREALRQGACYVLVTGYDLNVKERATLESCVCELFDQEQLKLRFKIFNASQLCDWISELPALYSTLGRPIGDLLSHAQWGKSGYGFDIILQADPAQRDFRQSLTELVRLNGQPTHIRVEGNVGSGKTRMVFEALDCPGIAERVLYALGPDTLHGLEFFGYLRSREQTSVILVVDECNASDIGKVAAASTACPGLTLISIGIPLLAGTPGTERTVHMKAPPMGEQQLQGLVQAAAPSLSRQATIFTAYQAGGNAALAVRLARALLSSGVDTMSAAVVAGSVAGQFAALLLDPEERDVAEALSLLQQVGCRGVVESEGRAIADFVGIPWDKMQRTAERLQERGLIRLQGRYWNVEPPLLAVHLASQAWQRKRKGMFALPQLLASSEARKAFWARLGEFGEYPATSRIVTEMLIGSEPLCSSVDDLNEHASTLKLFVPAAPAAVLGVLDRVLGRGELAAGISGGAWHQVVWTLEYLLWLPSTYDGAVRLLRKLASAEESRPQLNTARSAWRAVFQPSLGGTSVPALERHPLLAEMLGSPDEGMRLLALDGVSASLAAWQVRNGGQERGGTLLPAEWQPRSYEDIRAVAASALSLLDRALADQEPRVRQAAIRVLIGAARDLTRIGLADEVIARLEEVIDTPDAYLRDVSDRLDLRSGIEELQSDASMFTAAQLERLRSLHARHVGTDFRSRLVYWVGRWTIGQSGLSSDDPGMRALAGLAQEADESPHLLLSELAWLYSDDAFHALDFAHALGERDSQGRWQEDLMASARRGEGSEFLALYLLGRMQHEGGISLEEQLDYWACADRSLVQVVRVATARGEPTDSGARRLIDLVDRDWLPVWALGSICWGSWPTMVQLSTTLALLERLSGDADERSPAFALNLLDRRLEAKPTDRGSLAPIALPLLARLCTASDELTIFRWNRVASSYVDTHARAVAESIAAWLRTHDIRATGQDAFRVNLLGRAGQAEPDAVWALLAPAFAETNPARHSYLLELSPVLAVFPLKLLFDWAAEDAPVRAARLAQAIPMGGTDIPVLARTLLIQFGNEISVGVALDPHLRAASYYGDYASYLQEQLERVTAWTKDPHPTIARWARQLVLGLQAQMANVDEN